MSFVKFSNGMLSFTLAPNLLCYIQVSWAGGGAKKMTIKGDPNGVFTFVTCPLPAPPVPPDIVKIVPDGGTDMHHLQLDPANPRSMKITLYHENGIPCPPTGGIDPNDKITAGLEIWEYQDPNDPRRQASAWLFNSKSDTISTVIIVEPDSGAGAGPKRMMNAKWFKDMNTYLSVVQSSLGALVKAWSRDLAKFK